MNVAEQMKEIRVTARAEVEARQGAVCAARDNVEIAERNLAVALFGAEEAGLALGELAELVGAHSRSVRKMIDKGAVFLNGEQVSLDEATPTEEPDGGGIMPETAED